ncbi:hypothetical protein [Streptomyces sp. NPDC056387]|uniref:hypothetical protein n=1 Tax=Streptomyces sp. NPDC056387 TaxID=3345803 RepID=UPI0035D8C4A9
MGRGQGGGAGRVPWVPHLAALPAAELLPAMRTVLRRDPPKYHASTAALELLAL